MMLARRLARNPKPASDARQVSPSLFQWAGLEAAPAFDPKRLTHRAGHLARRHQCAARGDVQPRAPHPARNAAARSRGDGVPCLLRSGLPAKDGPPKLKNPPVHRQANPRSCTA